MASTYMVSMPGHTFHAVAANDAVSAGDLVNAESSDDVMTAISSAGYDEDDVKVDTATASDDAIIVGIALTDAAAAADTLSVATSGLFIIEAGAAVTAGAEVSQETTAQKVEDSTDALYSIGRALTGASAAGKYVLIKLNL